jgi:hypothetical protein
MWVRPPPSLRKHSAHSPANCYKGAVQLENHKVIGCVLKFLVMIKECKKHGLTEFRLYKNGNRKAVYKCLKCNVDAVKRRRHAIKKKAVEYMGGKCVKCGYNKCIAALEFHHPDSNKEFGIGANGYTHSWIKLKKELDKCILVCSNCHKEIGELSCFGSSVGS